MLQRNGRVSNVHGFRHLVTRTAGTIPLLAQAVGPAAAPLWHLVASASLLLIRDYRPMSPGGPGGCKRPNEKRLPQLKQTSSLRPSTERRIFAASCAAHMLAAPAVVRMAADAFHGHRRTSGRLPQTS